MRMKTRIQLWCITPNSLLNIVQLLPKTCWTASPASHCVTAGEVEAAAAAAGGNLLINGQRIAGKDNSASDQLERITAAEVESIEIIRDTTGALNVRGASEVINVILVAVESRSSTTIELINRLNHDGEFETGGSVAWSQQIGNFQALVNLRSRPNYENRDNREVRLGPDGELLGTLFQTTIRDKDEQNFSTNLSYRLGPSSHAAKCIG